ncbi:hypothetical protein JCM33774_18340 [Actinophytocola sp. KF-1]
MANGPDAPLSDNAAVSARLAAIEKRLDEIIMHLDDMNHLVSKLGRTQLNRQQTTDG